MVGVAFEVHDAMCAKKRDTESEEEFTMKKQHLLRPSSLDIIHYSLCYVGLFTGDKLIFRV